MGRDIVVIGASAGGIEAMTELIGELPADLPAALLAVVHVAEDRPSILKRILGAAGKIPVDEATHLRAVEKGRLYLAPPGAHLVVADSVMKLVRGPRENRLRPAVDPLFRSAARVYGERVVGVVLSGALDCGTAGLAAIKKRGGVVVAQDPEEALVATMPQSAIENVAVDHILPTAEIAKLLVRLAREQVPRVARPPDERIDRETAIAGGSVETPVGTPSMFQCPECAGVLFEVADEGLMRFRCHVGHAFGAEGLVTEQQVAVEGAFWAALRALEEQAALNRRLAQRAKALNQRITSERFAGVAESAEQQAAIVRQVLLSVGDQPKRN